MKSEPLFSGECRVQGPNSPVCPKIIELMDVFMNDALSCVQAILYNSSRAENEATDSQQSQQGHKLPSGLEILGPVVPPALVLPSEFYPSVLITEAQSSNAVTVR